MIKVEEELREEKIIREERRNGEVLLVESKTYDLLGKKPIHK